jgi:hypothetical protein
MKTYKIKCTYCQKYFVAKRKHAKTCSGFCRVKLCIVRKSAVPIGEIPIHKNEKGKGYFLVADINKLLAEKNIKSVESVRIIFKHEEWKALISVM